MRAEQFFPAQRGGLQGAPAHVALIDKALAGQDITRRLPFRNRGQGGGVAFDAAGQGDVGDQVRQVCIIGLADLELVADPGLVAFLTPARLQVRLMRALPRADLPLNEEPLRAVRSSSSSRCSRICSRDTKRTRNHKAAFRVLTP
jgi:hypothetical protein